MFASRLIHHADRSMLSRIEQACCVGKAFVCGVAMRQSRAWLVTGTRLGTNTRRIIDSEAEAALQRAIKKAKK
jgi:hypothetical protein